MSWCTVSDVRIAGLATAVPSYVRTVADEVAAFGEDDAARISQTLGVRARRIAPAHMCTSDLCFAAAVRLLDELAYERESIDGLIFVSQTPDYVLPATGCSLHSRLRLSRSCAAFDINLGCSGYVYAVFLAAMMLAGKGARRVLLLVGDTATKIISPQDQSVALLFGDAASATIVEAAPGAASMTFELGTDGSGAGSLIIPAGGFRNPRSASTCVRSVRDGGNIRSDEDVAMNGAEIFTFSIGTVPQLVRSVLAHAGWGIDDTGAFVFHQANRFMLEHLAKRLKIPAPKLTLGIGEYGNTSSASIPLAMTTELREPLRQGPMRLVLAGFGVGLSWAAAALTCGPIVMPDLVEVAEVPAGASAASS